MCGRRAWRPARRGRARTARLEDGLVKVVAAALPDAVDRSCAAGKTHCHPHSRAAFGYFRASASGSRPSPRPAARSRSCSASHRVEVRARAGRRSRARQHRHAIFAALALAHHDLATPKSTSLTRSRRHSSSRSPLP